MGHAEYNSNGNKKNDTHVYTIHTHTHTHKLVHSGLPILEHRRLKNIF